MALLRPSPSSRIIPAHEAWNQTASDDGIFNPRVRLNEAWYKENVHGLLARTRELKRRSQ
jgi:hypothetical protein